MEETGDTLILGNAPEVETDEEAWNLCLQKWRAIVKAHKEGKDVENYWSESCAFCVKYVPNDCEGCPIFEVTERDECDGTPYYEYTRNRSVNTARKELDFIQSIGEFNDWVEEEEEPEVDQEILEEMKNSIQNKVDTLKESVAYYLKDLMTAETLESVMEIKREILLEFVDKMPLGIHACYFCIKHQDNCDECKYGEVHGKCLDSDSDYHQVEIIRRSLKQALRDHYHTDEDRY